MNSSKSVLVRLAVPVVALLGLLAFGAAATASTFTFETNDNPFPPGHSNQGWWSPTRFNNDTNDNFLTGRHTNQLFRSFFTFDLTTLDSCIVTGAVLMLHHQNSEGSDGSSVHELSIFDVSTDVAILNNNHGVSAAIYEDLGSGKVYGSASIPNGVTGVESIALNAVALADIQNSLGDFFSVGGSLTNLAPSGDDHIFGNTDNLSNQLELECADSKTEILKDSGVPGRGLSDAPGLQKEFNPKSAAAGNAGQK